MTRGVNRVLLSGRAEGPVQFHETTNNSSAASFYIASERHTHDSIVRVRAKINAYGKGLVSLLRVKLASGVYVLVDGELMNRRGQHEELIEVRATQIIFPTEDQNAAGSG